MRDDYAEDFGPFEGAIWLNCAHQGALPRVAAAEAEEAVAWKRAPWNLTTERFGSVPQRLRQALGRLIDAPAEEIILGNSASYGLHLLANGIRWQAGDEALLMWGDFPSAILPWLGLERRGVKVRLIRPKGPVIEPDELLENITASTRLLCLTLVHSFSGYAVDAGALGEICRARGVTFVLNVSQALGARRFSVASEPVDAVTNVGFKWLCGPYGTGFCWIRPELRESLEYNQAYWLAMQTADDLAKEPGAPVLRSDLGARRYDVFGTANFFNFKPWAASVEYLLSQGIENIEAYSNRLVTRLIDGLDPGRYVLHSPRSGASRSTLVFITHKQPERHSMIYEELRNRKVFIAQRAGKLRLSPHLYNTPQEIDQALSVLNSI
ncbi:MAG: aminotransferase class V-fold PLP-dependent enzyme [Blastocatellia bacterium]